VRKGEILGVAGLVGSGRTELFEGLVGLRPAEARRFTLRGTDRSLPEAREAWRLGLAYLTEDRRARGLLLEEDLPINVGLTVGALAGGARIDRRAEHAAYEAARRRFDVRAARPEVKAGRLSGGNQQKVLIAKTLASAQSSSSRRADPRCRHRRQAADLPRHRRAGR
jgi:ribose transport system ATP-binding protein